MWTTMDKNVKNDSGRNIGLDKDEDNENDKESGTTLDRAWTTRTTETRMAAWTKARTKRSGTQIRGKNDLQHTSQNGQRPTICANNLNNDQQPMIWDKNSTVEDDMQTI